jgi:hypothetical protein
MRIYLVGSLKDPYFPVIADALREAGYDVFDDWRGAGPDGDRRWRDYELNERGRGYHQAVYEDFAVNGRTFDTCNIVASDAVVAVCKKWKLPGASAIAELAFAKYTAELPTFILMNGEPEDWDLMLPLVAQIVPDLDTLLEEIGHWTSLPQLDEATTSISPVETPFLASLREETECDHNFAWDKPRHPTEDIVCVKCGWSFFDAHGL